MKKIIVLLVLGAMIAARPQTAMAGDREWAVAGKVLTGVAVASVISQAFHPPPPVVYAPPPIAYLPAPRVIYHPRVYVQPRRVYVRPAPVYLAPPPVMAYPPPVPYYLYYYGRPRHRVCW